VGATAVALLGLTAVASASEIPASGSVAAFGVSGSHHYRISFYVSPRAAVISVGKGGKGLLGSETEYFRFQGEATEKRIVADFGHRGRVAVRFRPNGDLHKRKLHGCSGGPEVTRFGVFEGTIRFHGERGYTEFEGTRVPGSLTSRPRQVCHRHRRKRSAHKPRHEHHAAQQTITVFRAESSDGVRFEALRSSEDPKTSLFFAVDSEASEGNLILRRAITVGHLGSFAFDPKLDTATLKPPAPFSGNASFQRLDDYTTRWEGPLAISFPGLPDVPLTGRDFSWSLSSSAVGSGGVAFFRGPPKPREPPQLGTYQNLDFR
jgi:hypothetical protein